MENFREIKPQTLSESPFELIGKRWMLISAGNEQKLGTMTASWGMLGVLWSKSVATCFVRPQRYTFKLLQENSHFSLSFFEEEFRPALLHCGKISGRDEDKIAKSGLTPVFSYSAPTFEQANLCLICRKMYVQQLDPAEFLDAQIAENYPEKDYHFAFVGEIEKTLENR